jgi:hypothetical protein
MTAFKSADIRVALMAHAATARRRPFVVKQSSRKGEDLVDGPKRYRVLATLLLHGRSRRRPRWHRRRPPLTGARGELLGPVVIPCPLCAATGRAKPAPGTALADRTRSTGVQISFPWPPSATECLPRARHKLSS